MRTNQSPSVLAAAESLLKGPHELLAQFAPERDARQLPLRLTAIVTIGFAAFGFVVGLPRGPLAGAAGATKLVIVALGSLAVCLPALYVYGRFLGSVATPTEVVGESLVAMGTAAITLLALCPVALALSWIVGSTRGSYFYMVLGSTALLGFACLRGVGRLASALHQRRRPTLHLWAWAAIFGLVGLQWAWLMRPFIGSPRDAGRVVVLRPLERSAFDGLYKTAYDALEASPLYGTRPGRW